MTKKSPFSISPNPANLYLTASLKETNFKIKWAIEERRGLTCIFGDVGLGKSSILRSIHGDYEGDESYNLSMIRTPNYSSAFGLLKGICLEFKLAPRNSLDNQEKELHTFLFEQFDKDKNTVIFIDEAQRLNDDMIELIRTLLNLETNTTKLIQICLVGQIELKERLLKTKHKAVRSRIYTYSVLEPMNVVDMTAMLKFRCERGGVDCPIPDDLFQELYDLSLGVPRDVLKICDLSYALMHQYDETEFNIDLVTAAAKKVLLEE